MNFITQFLFLNNYKPISYSTFYFLKASEKKNVKLQFFV
ncbi:hypothetical protein NC99_03830 [Sunxiuqinia dokdonensis]|uniref:Uncharacterized protein n=1 Tax=Sunxiuqinia dokdonensis TaxID=1409788 RepID=A0A0L8VF60_9BACT|nr:hypothetical protein NC99_03830 [Sunxiuqinia dokdonensis]